MHLHNLTLALILCQLFVRSQPTLSVSYYLIQSFQAFPFTFNFTILIDLIMNLDIPANLSYQIVLIAFAFDIINHHLL